MQNTQRLDSRCALNDYRQDVTWRTTHSQVLEVASFDDLHRQAAGVAVISQSKEQFRCAAVHHRLARRSTVTPRHARQAGLRLAVLKQSPRPRRYVGQCLADVKLLYQNMLTDLFTVKQKKYTCLVCHSLYRSMIVTDRISVGGDATTFLPSVRLFLLCLRKRLTVDLERLHASRS